MAAQFGRWNFTDALSDPRYLERVAELLRPWGPDGEASYASGGINIIYSGFHVSEESRLERQPHVLKSGSVLTWDGRLDNRSELIRELSSKMPTDAPDVLIVAATYERWGVGAFRKLLGDWALSIWNPKDRSLILAKDPIGVGHMYYTRNTSELMWSTVLDPLVLLSQKNLEPDPEYIAGWLSLFPATHLTPYQGIHAVPPSSYVRLGHERERTTKYWDFDGTDRIRYPSDSEYEEHFRTVFRESVRRRLRSDVPVLAELSGGIDSSSIVCVADQLIAWGNAVTPRLDTLSCYDDREPNWNERPYFEMVEQKRGRTGCHIDVGLGHSRIFEFSFDRFAISPGAVARSVDRARQWVTSVKSQGNRVVLSGIGGDEVTGGVPTPTPELADLLARIRLLALARQLKVWALNKRTPWLHLLFEVLRSFLPQNLLGVPTHKRPAPWLVGDFVERHRIALTGYRARWKLAGPLPSFQANLATLEALRRQLGCLPSENEPLVERRYPYLDRDFLQFLYAIPREQLVRPDHRRSLMRRALAGIVPDEILNRRRKAFVARSPRQTIASEWEALVEMNRNMTAASLGIVDAQRCLDALNKARSGEEVAIVPLMRTFGIELWLKGLENRRTLAVAPTAPARGPGPNTKSAIAGSGL